MKKILILLAAILFGVSASFAQTYVVTVSWENNECNCNDQGNSYYAVKVVIIDDANNKVVVSGKQVNVDFGTYTVDVSVPEVNNHCEDQTLQYPPSYEVYAGVTVFCDSYTPPEAICTTGSNLLSNQTCALFASGDVDIGPLYFD